MFVSVLDQDGSPVRDLHADDFVILEDDAPREVLRAGRALEAMQIALMIDTSSAARPVLRDYQVALDPFVEAMHGEHEIALTTFGGARSVLVRAPGSLEQLREGVSQLFARPDTAAYLLEALSQASRDFASREARRPVVIVLSTDGVDLSPEGHMGIVNELRATGVAMYAVLTPTATVIMSHTGQFGLAAFPSWASRERDSILDVGPKATGGLRYTVAMGSGTTEVLRRIAIELSEQYHIVYARPNVLVPPQRVRVGVKRPAVSVRSRPVLP